MLIDCISINQKIKISLNPKESTYMYGSLGGYKMTLAGTIQKVNRIDRDLKRIWIVPPSDSEHSTISFDISDLLPLPFTKIEVIKPELFNPDQLVI